MLKFEISVNEKSKTWDYGKKLNLLKYFYQIKIYVFFILNIKQNQWKIVRNKTGPLKGLGYHSEKKSIKNIVS